MNIQANDLRIGNLVYDRNGYIFSIDYFELDKICMELINKTVSLPTHPMTEFINKLKPIPITEEILLKCENVLCTFENAAGKVFGFFDNKVLINASSVMIKINNDVFYNGRQLYGLHEYQNIIKALSGEDLNVSKLTNK